MTFELARTGNDTALHLAARHCQPKVCHQLLLEGADPNQFDDTGSTPLTDVLMMISLDPLNWILMEPDKKAVYRERLEQTLAVLLDGGADPAIAGSEHYPNAEADPRFTVWINQARLQSNTPKASVKSSAAARL
jgi:hypothetical protein